MVMRMSYTLADAATATGLSKSIIRRAIKDGKLVGTKDEFGKWSVEPAELHLVFPPDRGSKAPAATRPRDIQSPR